MAGGIFDPEFDQLPMRIPIFPLPSALLLPGGQLPLNIFEPRYLAMVRHALATPTRLIGMVQPLDHHAGGDIANDNIANDTPMMTGPMMTGLMRRVCLKLAVLDVCHFSKKVMMAVLSLRLTACAGFIVFAKSLTRMGFWWLMLIGSLLQMIFASMLARLTVIR